MKDLPRWGYAKLEERKGKATKVPYSATGAKAKPNDITTWASFGDALTAFEACDDPHALCLGFLLQPPYMVIDLDLGKMDPDEAKQCEADFDAVIGGSYKEHSQSGSGVHYFIKSDMPLPRKRHGHVEIYTEGRFIALTGNATADRIPPVLTIPAKKLQPVYQKYIPDRSKPKHPQTVTTPVPLTPLPLSDGELLEKIRSSKQGVRFKELWDGTYSVEEYGSRSEADGALCVILAFWTQHDGTRMDALFRQSALMRPKWDEMHGQQTYGQITIDSALTAQKGDYRPRREHSSSPVTNTPWRSYDDRGAADRLMDRYGKIFLYDTQAKMTLFYNGLVWKEDTTRKLEGCYNAMADSLKDEPIHAPAYASQDDADAAAKARSKFINKVRNLNGKRGALSFFRDQIATGTDVFDTDNSLINTPSNVLKLADTITRLPHRAEQYLSMITAGKPSNKPATRWQKFLGQVFDGDKDLIDFIQRAVGYSIAGTNYERVMFVLYGEGEHNGSNGKSVFVQTIANVLGDYAVTINPAALAEKKFGDDADKPNPEISRLEHKRFVTTSELPKNMKLNEALIKRLTSGEKLPVRDLYKGTREFMPTSVMWLTSNYKPVIQGQDSAIWKRLVFIPMTAQIEHVVLGLTDILTTAEKDEIFQWILDGYCQYKKQGLNVPDDIIGNNVAYKSEMDVVQQFTDDCIDLNGNTLLSNRLITERFNEWAPSEGVTMSGQTFIAMFKDRYASRVRRVNSLRGFDNMALKSANPANP